MDCLQCLFIAPLAPTGFFPPSPVQALTKFIKQHATIEYELPKKGGDKEEEKEEKDEL